MKRLILIVVSLLLIGFVTFYFWGSSANLSTDTYDQFRQYGGFGKEYAKGDTLRVMTYNLGYLSGMTNNEPVQTDQAFYDRNLQRTISLIRSIDPDLIGFQEIDFEARRSYDVQQADAIGIAGEFTDGFHSVNWDKRYVPFPYGLPKYHFGKVISGQSILSKSTLTQQRHLTLPRPVNTPFYYNAFYIDRLVQVADWIVGMDTIKVMNLHLEAFDQETRLIHARQVRELYERYYKDMPVLILGDYNSRPAEVEEDAMSIIMEAPDIASAVSGEQYQSDSSAYFTYSSVEPVRMIDYVLYNSHFIERINSRVLSEAGDISDHLPLLFEFVLKE